MQNFIDSLNHFKPIKFSFIIPAYKVKEYIEDCLISIQNQTYFKYNPNCYEILIGVDGCEETLNELKRIKNNFNNIRIFYGDNKGLPITRNTLIKYSRFDNLIIIDSDDYIDKNTVYKLTKIINLKFEYIRFMLNYYMVFEEELKRFKLTIHELYESKMFKKPFVKIYRSESKRNAPVYVKKELWYKIGGYSNLNPCEDYDFDYRIESYLKSENKDLFSIEDKLYFRRCRIDSLSKKKDFKKNSKKNISETNNRIRKKDFKNQSILTNDTMKEIIF